MTPFAAANIGGSIYNLVCVVAIYICMALRIWPPSIWHVLVPWIIGLVIVWAGVYRAARHAG